MYSGELVNHQFGNIGNDGEAARHIPVKRAIADSLFGFVAGAEYHGTKLIGERHEVIATNARLDIFFGGVLEAVGESGGQGLLYESKTVAMGKVRNSMPRL